MDALSFGPHLTHLMICEAEISGGCL